MNKNELVASVSDASGLSKVDAACQIGTLSQLGSSWMMRWL